MLTFISLSLEGLKKRACILCIRVIGVIPRAIWLR